MESLEAKDLIGKEVWWSTGKKFADIVSYEKGWVTIKTDDDVEHKVRARDLMLTDSTSDIGENEEGKLVEVTPDLTQTVGVTSSVVDSDTGEIMCNCGLCFTPPKQECFKCPDCGNWHRVKIRAKLEHYVKGMGATASGRDTLDIDDEVATELRSMNLDELYNYVCNRLESYGEIRFSKAMAANFKKSGMSCAEFLESKYAKLNPGMQRMNIGNVLRGAIARKKEADLVKEVKEEALGK
jgi:hypothetical protein